MTFDITVQHPEYIANATAWELMRDASRGEDAIKAKGQMYLPSKTGIEAISDPRVREKVYDRYKLRAEFPELVALTVRGAVGTMLDKPAVIELPPDLEHLRENVTRDGLTLDAMHRRIAAEIMLMGRYVILPTVGPDGKSYLAGYVAESAINWDTDESGVPNYLVLNESGLVRDLETNQWETVEKYRELFIEDGRYLTREWVKTKDGWTQSDPLAAFDRKQRPIDFLPAVFAGSNDLTPDPDEMPLHGLAKLAVRIYRMDADLTTSLHMTSEPTPVVTGYEDPAAAIKEGKVPKGIGASALWVLPKGGDGKFLEFTGAGIEKQVEVIQKNYDRAVMFGAQMLADQGRAQESGDSRKLRLDNQHSTLKTVAMTSAAGLERALKNLAIWVGADADKVVVTPNLEFFDQTLSGSDIDAIVRGWIEGAYSWETTFERLKKGNVIPDDRTPEDERKLIDKYDRVGLTDEVDEV